MTAGKCGNITYVRYSALQPFGTYVYKPDGELKDSNLKMKIEEFFNNEAKKIQNGIILKQENDNW